MNDVFHFGYKQGAGHCWQTANGRESQKVAQAAVGERLSWEIDSRYCPPKSDGQTQGAARLSKVNDWTVLAWWDRTGDARGNSNSCIVARGEHGFDEMLALANQHFPGLMQRQTAPVELVTQVAP